MKLNRRIVVIGVAAGVLAVGGVGIAQAVGGSSEEPVTGPAAEQAKSAALKAAGGGTVLEIERQDGDGPAGGSTALFEVEVRRLDGSQIEIHLDDRFQPVGKAPDDDSGAESDSESGSDDGSDG